MHDCVIQNYKVWCMKCQETSIGVEDPLGGPPLLLGDTSLVVWLFEFEGNSF